jgi:hypothetical protein
MHRLLVIERAVLKFNVEKLKVRMLNDMKLRESMRLTFQTYLQLLKTWMTMMMIMIMMRVSTGLGKALILLITYVGSKISGIDGLDMREKME